MPSFLELFKRKHAVKGPALPPLISDDPARTLFPSTPGSYWDYRVDQAMIRQTCRGKTVIDRQEYVKFEGSDGETLYYRVTPEKLVFCPEQAILNRDETAMISYLEAGRRTGEAWPTEGKIRIMLLAGLETVNAAGRDLSCWRVESYNLEGDLLEQTWFAEGVGLVKKVMFIAGVELMLHEFYLAPPGEAASLRVESNNQGAEVGLGFIPTGVPVPFELDNMAPELLMVSSLAPPPELILQKMVRLKPGQQKQVEFTRRWSLAPVDTEAPDDIHKAAITCMHACADGTTWVGTLGNGLFMWDGRLWTRFDRRNSLADDYISALAADDQGRLWIGTHGRGLACLERSQDRWTWDLYHKGNSALEDNFISDLLAAPEGLWVGTELGGLALFSNDRWQNITLSENCPDGFVGCLAKIADGMLAGTNRGLYKWAGGRWELVPGSNGHSVRAVAAAEDGSIWWGTYQEGAFRLSNEGVQHFCRENGNLINDNVWRIMSSSHGLWLATGRGVTLVEAEDKTTYGSDSVLCLAVVGEQVWLGTNQGLRVIGKFEVPEA